MRIKAVERVCVAVALLATPSTALAENVGFDTEGIQEFLHRSCDGKNAGMVIGVVDEHGTQVFGAGKLDNGTDDEVNGDTLFEIGSITKTFTVLLLEDMVNRGEMKLDDPVEKYLPESVKVPSRGGKKITLLNLAAQDSGLPHDGTNMVRRDSEQHVCRLHGRQFIRVFIQLHLDPRPWRKIPLFQRRDRAARERD